ncbi:MAG: GH3 auxin-responsive promoter family protein [Gemmataceae bacterium]
MVLRVAIPVERRLAQFEAATLDPQRVQEAVLRDILAAQADTGFGRDHRFADIRTVADFRRRIPVAGYEAVEPYMTRVLKGETNALLADPRVYMFAMTSGTTATRKYIGHRPLPRRLQARWNLWSWSFRITARSSSRRSCRWPATPTSFVPRPGCRAEAVTGLTASMQGKIVRWMYCVPGGVARIKDPQASITSSCGRACRGSVPACSWRPTQAH